MTRNPLADPYLLGVSSGAGFGVVVVTVLGLGVGALGAFTVPVAAFLGAMVPLFLSLAIGGRYPQPTAVILVGVASAQVFSALITFSILVVADEHQLSSVMHWLAGGFGDSRWSTAIFPAVALATVGAAMMLSASRIDLLQAGDDGAAALGMNVRRFRVVQLLGVSMLAGAAVSVAGGIGFIGLLVPHLAGYVVGARAVGCCPSPHSSARSRWSRRTRPRGRSRTASRSRWASSPRSWERRSSCGCSTGSIGGPNSDRAEPATGPRRTRVAGSAARHRLLRASR